MTVSISTTGSRTSSTLDVPITLPIGANDPIADDMAKTLYVPIVLSGFQATPFSLTGQTIIAGQTTFTLLAADFAKLRVGDVLTGITGTTVTIPSPSTYTRTANTFAGLNFIVITGSSSLPLVGDTVTGSTIDGTYTVTSVDPNTRRVYLSDLPVESTLAASPITVTFTPPVRIVSLNATTLQVTLNSTFTGTGTDTNSTLAFTPLAFSPVLYYLEAVHTATTPDRLNITVKAYSQDGTQAFDATGIGTDGTSRSTVRPSIVGSLFINTDSYLTNARKPRTNS